VKHDQVVSLKERFQDGRERYAQYHSPEQEARFKSVEERCYALEKILFTPIDLRVGDIN
jgi:hypothetical protein